MSMNMIKIEESILPVRHRRCMPGGGAPEVTRAKRTRRNAADVVTGNGKGENGAMTTVKKSSRFRGVSRHRWTGRYEAHLWDKLSWNVTQKKKGKQVYLGAYDDEEAAARTYDLAALKYWGTSTFTNFPIPDYEQEIQIMQTVTKEEYLTSLRRKSSGFSRGLSKYRGLARWEARIGRVFGNKYLYLGTYSTQEEAAWAYGLAAIEYRGINAVTNFDLSNYNTCLNPLAKTANPPQEAKPSTNMLQSHLHAVKQLQIPSEKETYDTKVPFRSYRRPSSPTALGLLLRSSVFKELVEKNSNLSEEESSDDANTKSMQQTSSSEEYGVLFNDIPFMLSSNGVDDMPLGQLHWNQRRSHDLI